MHLDGARLLNALVEQQIHPVEYCKDFDTVSFCLSKGMGCPLGSVLLGSEKDIWFAKNMRKMVGGGMRQAGMTAACAMIALEDWEEVLARDNANARMFAKELGDDVEGVTCDSTVVQTNIFAFVLEPRVEKHIDHFTLVKKLREEHDILMFPSFQNDAIRVVTHRDVSTEDLYHLKGVIQSVLKPYL